MFVSKKVLKVYEPACISVLLLRVRSISKMLFKKPACAPNRPPVFLGIFSLNPSSKGHSRARHYFFELQPVHITGLPSSVCVVCCSFITAVSVLN